MKVLRNLTVFSVFSLVVGSTLPANATVMTFNDLGLDNYDDIPGTYGDNVTSTNDGVGSYLEGNGFTPNISVEYQTIDPENGTTLANNLDYWSDNYGNLEDVAYPVNDGYLGEISLIPENGYSVQLNSFDLGGWYQETKQDQTIRVLDSNSNLIADYSPFDVTGDGHNTLTPNIVSDEQIKIQFGPSWDTGIDNINFDQTTASTEVPESFTMLGTATALGMGICGVLKRKHTNQA